MYIHNEFIELSMNYHNLLMFFLNTELNKKSWIIAQFCKLVIKPISSKDTVILQQDTAKCSRMGHIF